MRRSHIYLIVWGLFLVVLSFIPGRPQPTQGFHPDKLMHLAAFGYLGYLAGRSFGLWALFAAVGFGFINELQQLISPGREVAVWDFLANEIGVVAGFAVGFVRRRRALRTG